MKFKYLYMDSKSSLNPASTVTQPRWLAVLISHAREKVLVSPLQPIATDIPVWTPRMCLRPWRWIPAVKPVYRRMVLAPKCLSDVSTSASFQTLASRTTRVMASEQSDQIFGLYLSSTCQAPWAGWSSGPSYFAFDIECTKVPLKFPDADLGDQVMKIRGWWVAKVL